ncbi:histidine kinase/DNA gyrase B/HSP90-like ATPase [Nonlabens dokdonensis]|uniref:histidine kinase n=2 Tax=Nonlabens dokdonensis TaxID=328515 RepID=L7WBQ5_NONDD|nr:HAMP domain-containing sensor histidine kinase [Nonlabens dokdonensis]AGC77662.1 sensor protein [Nonlabens dokdonensis DSW-6]PZX39796.1 histidine kinase/DNA gyrase B/HSP90-like ATPase [Nonlabens dokdonensis]
MTYKSYVFSLTWRVFLLIASVTFLAFWISWSELYLIVGASFVTILVIINLYKFVLKRFIEMDDFFESVKYRDFSRWFVETKGSQDIRELHKGFNLVNSTIKSINRERQAQFVYLQKILEMVDVGIIAYNVEDGSVLWTNDSLLQTLDLPSFKNISFIESRRPEVYQELFETYHTQADSITLKMRQEETKILISDTIFEIEESSFKLIVLQNIEETLNKNESEAWKKLLSVMTHEIMNSIAPISSLAETLETNLKSSIEQPQENNLDSEDILAGISSIRKRSEGLMQFAKTYRSLNKVTQINRLPVQIDELFESIEQLLQPTILEKNVTLEFKVTEPNLIIKMDNYLIEQVLINLIINAIEAAEEKENPTVIVTAGKTFKGNFQITVQDNGTGITQEVLENVFVPFFSTKKRGSGVGLSLSKQIMNLHQGKIQLRNINEGGTEARLIF